MPKKSERPIHWHPVNPTGRCSFNGLLKEPCTKKRCAPKPAAPSAHPAQEYDHEFEYGGKWPGICGRCGGEHKPAAPSDAKARERPLPPQDEPPRLCWSCRADQWGCTVYPNGCCPDCDHYKKPAAHPEEKK